MTELSGRFDTWVSFQDHMVAAMALAAVEPVDLVLCDRDFSRWPLSLPSILDAFHQWSVRDRTTRCTLLAASFERFAPNHPRWVAWRQPWGHRVKCLQVPDEMAQDIKPTFIMKGQVAIRIMDERHGAGIWSRDEATIEDWLLEIDVISQRSHEAQPVTTLGL